MLVRFRQGGAAFSLLAGLGLLLSTSGCSNSCERLCESYYQMELRCELLSCDACSTNSVCTGEEGTPVEYNVLLQETEYKVRQCQADYRRLIDGVDGELGEDEACQSYASTMEGLVDTYDNSLDDCDRRLLCEQYADLQEEMGLTE